LAELKLSLMHPSHARLLEPDVSEKLRAALMGDARCALQDVLEDIAAERAQLWVICDGPNVRMALVTRILEYPRGRAMLIQLCGGGPIAECLTLLAELEGHARGLGCAWMEVRGRKGWSRLLPGYDTRSVELTKEL
jgi:hypothetical protein